MNVFKLDAAIGLNTDSFKKGLASAGESMSDMGDKIKAGAAAIGKVTAAGMAAAGAGVASLAKQSVAAYADYEQLVGGVEKLFGESSDMLMDYAKNAYRTAGMSVNAYMETVTGFSAALVSSVQAAGGSMEDAVKYADIAMQDMSDNANVYGSDISSIQAAYQGFAKQNYQMLDNLKLGYGGSKTEMERLIADANKLRREQGINTELTVDSYSDIIEAIHTVQTEMNITGTTAKEAAKTISGSVASTKAAWENLFVEISKEDGDIETAFDVLGENIGNVVDNILPRVEQSFSGIGNVVQKSAPKISKAIKDIVPKVLPGLLESGATLFSSLGVGLLSSIPDMADAGLLIMEQINDSLKSANFDSDGLLKGIATDIKNRIPQAFQIGREILETVTDSILNVDYRGLGESLSEIAISGLDNISELIANVDWEKAGADIADFVNGIDWKGVIKAALDGVKAAIKAAPELFKGFFNEIDLESAASAFSLVFAPKMLGSLTGKLKTESYTDLHDVLKTKIGDGANSCGLSFGSKFAAGLEAFMVGYDLGTVIYNAFQDDIDGAVHSIMSDIEQAFGGDGVVVDDEQTDAWEEAWQNMPDLKKQPNNTTYQAIATSGVGRPSDFPGVADTLMYQQNLAAFSAVSGSVDTGFKINSPGDAAYYLKKKALGGISRRPEVALIGEAGTEAAIPLYNDNLGIKQIADQITRNMGAGTINNNYITVNAEVANDYDVERLADKLTDSIDKRLQERHVASVRASGGAW